MRFYRVEQDWITYLEGDFRLEVIETIRSLSLDRLQKYPPPKLTGLPIGNESRILLRYLRDRSSQLDASAFSKFYRSLASDRERTLYDAFRQNLPLTGDDWAGIIGAENVEKWTSNRLLRTDDAGRLICQFCVITIDGIILLTDPLNDHGHGVESVALANDLQAVEGDGVQPFHHTYVGLDSLRQIEEMELAGVRHGGRYLDCGTGAGALLLYFARRFDEALGIDINPRAVNLAAFNAELNRFNNCKVKLQNALELGGSFGRFDLISWNLPFIFLPEEEKGNSIDAFGGELGIELCLAFVEKLPEILARDGVASIAAIAPILRSGENVLETRLRENLSRLGLDCRVKAVQSYFAHTRELWEFHKAHGIQSFESVYLFISQGSGAFRRIDSSVPRRFIDSIRRRYYTREFKS